MNRLATLALFAFAAPAIGQSPAVQQAAADLAGRVNGLEQRVAAIEAKMGMTAITTGKRTYEDAYAKALATGLPLVVWNGSAICPPCIDSTDGTEFINFVGTVPGCPTNAITVSVPSGQEILGVGAVDQWITNDATYGHVPSVRRLLQRWRNRFVAQAATASYSFAPAVSYGSPMLMMGSSGGCATCGASSNSRGLFGFRR